MGNVFGEKKSAKEIVREQKRLVNRSVRQLEREITGLKREEAKIIKNIKKDAKANQLSSVKIMAKDLVRIRKQQTKFLNLTAQLRAISLQMTTVQSINTMSESIKKVSTAMTKLNAQIKLPELQKAINNFVKQSEKMEMKQEVMQDAMEDVFDDVEDEEESEQIVNQVLDELQINLDQQLVDAPGKKVKQTEKEENKDKELEARMGNL
uniref:Uncharacterized protein n=1 Tax=Lotharella oceanica TaxID=641309 RepID=A0A7S2TJK4_9EUKA|eukprot:CAMPEP_0170179442 /NCGR_PEP_ID=MMETSP0040_2-20121228/17806_1 /TAXON_ID=641309 /ORGANISM="Lotharella oceanica, Strain CCMP622" /LENGTH=207 /DNA_ID=CAMNT_0010423529 /DNA_START=65 /DNA_END=688 /DNA_ORIENTATION=-